MKIAIASGKGGTGKTTLATNLALSLDNVQLLDCDVEEPDSHLFLDIKLKKIEDVFISIPERKMKMADKKPITMDERLKLLCAPTPPDAVGFLPKDVRANKDGAGSALCLPYIKIEFINI